MTLFNYFIIVFSLLRYNLHRLGRYRERERERERERAAEEQKEAREALNKMFSINDTLRHKG